MQPPDDPSEDVGAAQELRDVSQRLMAAIEDLRRLEAESRKVDVGSREFEVVSGQITILSKGIFAMATQQQALGEVVPRQNTTLDELDGGSRARPLSARPRR
ncbi:MAG TPA: hypothetical protein VKA85_02860 [Candidatus Limnocylindrales bacterium]|nr:hypothetical protein [Candidatus Limnocylindrales bacterium]